MPFELTTAYTPRGDQPQAIAQLAEGMRRGDRFQTLLGVTGSGKTFTVAGVIQELQQPTLVIAHNKTLAAQLCSEFRAFFSHNAVEYFVSYYDYYQPEAYIPQTDTYIEKDSSINDEIDRLRHSSTQAVLERRDVIVVASVSCIYGLGSPEEYQRTILALQRGGEYNRRDLLRQLVDMQFMRNEVAPVRGTFRVKGDLLEICPADEEVILRVDFWGDEIEKIEALDPTTGEVIRSLDRYTVFPATHFITSKERIERAIASILAELQERLDYFRARGLLLEAQRLEQRTLYDVEMMREVGYCNGIENYSRHLDGRAPGTPPHTLLDYFPKDFLLFIDESHQTIPQIHGMYGGDMSRKQTLVDYGFRLPSAMDNRPLRWEEFEERVGQVVFVSATPSPYERQVSTQMVEQIVRPTGLVDPEVEVRPTQGQIDDLIGEIRQRVASGERVLVTTLTKKMAEDLSEYLANLNIKVHYLHSDISTLERLEILRDLRLGVHDVVVGINLLREGLDLPEVSLVAILDADKEGFLRSETSLIQTIGRAARNVRGKVLMYADEITHSMQRAIEETQRRRAVQLAYNQKHGVVPATVQKAIRDVLQAERVAESRATYRVSPDVDAEGMPLDDLLETIQELEAEMKRLSRALEFEQAAILRDEITRLKKLLPDARLAEAVAIPVRPGIARTGSRPRPAGTAVARAGRRGGRGRGR
ncbi:MAG: excinuclease ABC subunit UvrB [Armatimonadetes bacterium]|nr:excinuclease ABC subunit UvrB [Armatimonadota bacterium]